MLFLHALLGRDTTPRIYGIGKATTLKKAMTNEHFSKKAQVFESAKPTDEELVTAGEQAIVSVLCCWIDLYITFPAMYIMCINCAKKIDYSA